MGGGPARSGAGRRARAAGLAQADEPVRVPPTDAACRGGGTLRARGRRPAMGDRRGRCQRRAPRPPRDEPSLEPLIRFRRTNPGSPPPSSQAAPGTVRLEFSGLDGLARRAAGSRMPPRGSAPGEASPERVPASWRSFRLPTLAGNRSGRKGREKLFRPDPHVG